MAQTQSKKTDENKIDKPGETNIYPVSEMDGASGDAMVQDEKSFGQGTRGAKGYEDLGTSEVIHLDSEKSEDKKN